MNSPLTGPPLKSSLDTLVEQFAQWRSTRASRRTPTPKHLQENAIKLLRDYRKSQVIKAIGINSTILKAWQGHQPAVAAKNAFIPLNLTEPSIEVSTLEFTLAYSQGSDITIKGSFSSAQLVAICQGLRPSQGSLGSNQ